MSTSGSNSNGGTNSTTDAFATIQFAYDAAGEEDIIEISDGTYTETSIETTKTVTITGTSADGTIIQASANQPVGDGSDKSPDMDIFKVKNGEKVVSYLLCSAIFDQSGVLSLLFLRLYS